MNIQNTEYNELIKTSFQGFHNNPRFSDVTMITDDFEAIQGHKLILSQASPLLDKLMMFNNPLVYLRGVKSEVFKTILEYVYTGSVSLKEDQVNTFITVSQELEIRGMSKVDCPELPSKSKAQPNESKESKTVTDELKHLKEQSGMPIDNKHDKKRFPCNQCDYSSLHKANLKRHQLSQHKVNFSCESCDYTTSIENHLKIHKSYIHRADHIKGEYLDETESDAEIEKLLQDDQDDNESEQGDEMAADETADLDKSQLQDDLKNINSTQCPGCEKSYNNKFNTIRHFKTAHLRQKFICKVCSCSLSSKDRLNRHVKAKHPNL